MSYAIGQPVLLWPRQCAGPVGVAFIERLGDDRVYVRLDGLLCVQDYAEVSSLQGGKGGHSMGGDGPLGAEVGDGGSDHVGDVRHVPASNKGFRGGPSSGDPSNARPSRRRSASGDEHCLWQGGHRW